jgi:hypothetical protein
MSTARKKKKEKKAESSPPLPLLGARGTRSCKSAEKQDYREASKSAEKQDYREVVLQIYVLRLQTKQRGEEKKLKIEREERWSRGADEQWPLAGSLQLPRAVVRRRADRGLA